MACNDEDSALCQHDCTVPVALAKAELQVSISQQLIISATEIDNGSFDNCDPNPVLGLRKRSTECSAPQGFHPSITLCAIEAGTTIQIELQVLDMSGNSSIVWSTIEVLE